MRQLSTDVLVIGGGAAGAAAALEANKLGLETLMVVKGRLGKSGCSIFAGNLQRSAPIEGSDTSSPENKEEREKSYKRAMVGLAKYSHYLGDQEYLRNAWRFYREVFYPWMESHGLYLLRDNDGELVSDLPRKLLVWAPRMGMSGSTIMDVLRKEVFRNGIPVLEETTATKLLTVDRQCVGATVLNLLNGDFYAIRAKSVILATGHSNYLATRATGTREGSAGGWMLAYEAGASLQDIEIQWYHASDIAYPATWMRLHLYPNPLPRTNQRSRLINSDGEEFYDGNWNGATPVPYIMQLKALVTESQQGRARFDGGYYSSFTHVEDHVLDDMYQTKFLHKIGIDPRAEPIESAVTWHMNQGGVRLDGQTMESGVPGLQIAGSVGGHVVGGIAYVIYDGKLAAETSATRSKALVEPPELDLEQAASEQERVSGLIRTTPVDGLLPGQIKKRIRNVVWEHLNYAKTAASLNRALEELEKVRREALPRMRLKSDSRRVNYDWMDALDVGEMLNACELIARFSLFREESRGGLYREDFPHTDNLRWLQHVVGRKIDGRLELETVPVDLPYARPEEEVVSFFKVDY